MPPEVKFCGITQLEDALYAAELGAGYAGVILAGGPRHRTIEQAAALLAPLRGRLGRVAVVGDQPLTELAQLAALVAPEVLQLHSTRPISSLRALRDVTDAALWIAVNARDGVLPPEYDDALRAADGILLDSLGSDGRGGTGRPADWERLAQSLTARGRPKLLVLAGGLRPDNLVRAIAVIGPDIVDVSSGIESAPGIKDRQRMAAFARVAASSARPVTR